MLRLVMLRLVMLRLVLGLLLVVIYLNVCFAMGYFYLFFMIRLGLLMDNMDGTGTRLNGLIRWNFYMSSMCLIVVSVFIMMVTLDRRVRKLLVMCVMFLM
jgi:hypothetical protein